MALTAETLRRLAALKLDPEAMSEVLSILADAQAECEKPRSAAAERQARYRKRKAHSDAGGITRGITRDVTSDVTAVTSEPAKEGLPQTPSKKTTSLTIVRENSRAQARKPSEDDFARLRNAYPRRAGGDPRDTAWRAFGKAVLGGADVEAIIAGARQFAAFRSGDDPKFTPMLATWLNRRGWLDDYTGPKPRAGPAPAGQRKDGWLEMYRKVHGLGEFAHEPADQGFDDGEAVTVDAVAIATGGRD